MVESPKLYQRESAALFGATAGLRFNDSFVVSLSGSSRRKGPRGVLQCAAAFVLSSNCRNMACAKLKKRAQIAAPVADAAQADGPCMPHSGGDGPPRWALAAGGARISAYKSGSTPRGRNGAAPAACQTPRSYLAATILGRVYIRSNMT